MPAQKDRTSSEDLVEILFSLGFITKEQLTEVKLEQVNTGRTAKKIITSKDMVSGNQLARAEAQLFHVPFVNLSETAISPEALSHIPHPVAIRYNLIPFSYNRNRKELSVAMVNPLDLAAINFIERKSSAKIKVFLAEKSAIKRSITLAYSQPLAKEVREALKEASPQDVSARAIDIIDLGKVIRQAPIAKIVSTVLEFSIKARSSDIHIEPEEEKTRVRYRIDGILHEKLVLPKKVHEAVISRIKILSGMKIDEKRIPQDGRFNFQAGSLEVDLRVSCVPTSHGEKIVMRLLKKGQSILGLPELGLRGLALKSLGNSVLRPHGIIIVCGPTGSGKTTTLYAALMRINTSKVNIMTLEDPVEYAIPGVNQVQINPGAGLTFASGLRSFVRQDPDVIMVGEIRDKETTELAIQAALTGHLVFSTLHTNDAAGAVPRLVDLGAESFLLASALTCVVAQRVVRRICDDCKEAYTPPPEVFKDIQAVLGGLYQEKEKRSLHRGRKCAQCNETGYIGRVGIFEVMPLSEKIGRLILERPPAETIQKQAVSEGMITMKQDGYLKVLEGMTTIEEVLRVAEE
ncbi:GspE/PulE family protein [Patescibacteria group bacterium]